MVYFKPSYFLPASTVIHNWFSHGNWTNSHKQFAWPSTKQCQPQSPRPSLPYRLFKHLSRDSSIKHKLLSEISHKSTIDRLILAHSPNICAWISPFPLLALRIFRVGCRWAEMFRGMGIKGDSLVRSGNKCSGELPHWEFLLINIGLHAANYQRIGDVGWEGDSNVYPSCLYQGLMF